MLTMARSLLIATLLAAPLAHAEGKVAVSLMAPVLEVVDASGARVAVVGRGSAHGLLMGARGSVYAPQAKSGVDAPVARGTLVRLEDQKAWFKLEGDTAGLARVKAGAQVEVTALIPRGVHRGQLFELALINVVFLDNYRKPIVPLADILNARDDSVEKRALEAMVKCGHEVIEFTKDLKAPISGKYTGRPVGVILKQAKPSDYRRFLRFVREYPGKYIGTPWKVSETFATWLVNNAPLSSADRVTELDGLSDRALRVHLKTMKKRDAKALVDYVADQVTSSRPDQLARAKRDRELLARMVRFRPSARGKAQLAFADAEILSHQGKREKAALAYAKAATAWKRAKETSQALVARNRAAREWSNLERYDRALKEIKAVRKAAKAAIKRQKDPRARAILTARDAYALTLKAHIDEKQGRYRGVVRELGKAVDKYLEGGFPGARATALDLLAKVARAQRKLGDREAATATYERMESIAEELGDQRRLARLRWDRGEMEFQAGDKAAAEKLGAEAEKIARLAGDLERAARSLGLQGQALWSLGRLEEAIARHDAGMKLREEIGEKSGIAWQSKMVAAIEKQRGDRKAAEKSLRRALDIYTALGRRGDEATVRRDLAELYADQKRFDDADREYQAAAKIFSKLKMGPDEARCFEGRAAVALKRKDTGRADKELTRAIAVYRRAGAKRMLAGAQLWRAYIRAELGDQAGALKAARQAARLTPDDDIKADVALLRANLALDRGQLKQAEVNAERSLKHARAQNDVERTIRAYLARYQVHDRQALFELANADAAKAIELARSSGNKPALLNALGKSAWELVSLGRLKDARAAAAEAQSVATAIEDPVERAWLFHTLAHVESAYGDLVAAKEHYDRGIEIMVKEKFAWGEAVFRFNRALLLLNLRDTDTALVEIGRVRRLNGKKNKELEIALAFAEAQAYVLADQPKRAVPILRKTLTVAEKRAKTRVGDALQLLARAYIDQGKWKSALPLLNRAVRMESRLAGNPYAARAALGVALAEKGDEKKAEIFLRDAVQRAEKRKGALPWRPLFHLARIEAERGDRAQARARLDQAVREIERGEAALKEEAAIARYRTDKLGVYKLLVELLLADGEVEAALGYVERAKAAELNDVQRAAGGGGDTKLAAAGSEIEAQEHKLVEMLNRALDAAEPDEERISRLESLIEKVRKERAAFIESLDRNDAIFDRYAVRPLQLEKMQKRLPPGVLVVSPVALADEVVVFALTNEMLVHFDVRVKPAALQKLVDGFLDGVRPDLPARGFKRKGDEKTQPWSADEVKRVSRRLYDLLLRQPLEAAPKAKTLVVSSTGALRYLPFAALHDGERFVAERLDVLRMTSLNQSAGPRQKGALNVLAVADPDGTLPGARIEAEALKTALPDVVVLAGDDATQARIKRAARRPGYAVLHLATHGRLDPKNPHESHIVLSGRDLRYGDIPTLDMPKTRLVVLSACDTAAKARGSGVEIAGLAYQFQRTNVQSVLATLWPVTDAETADFMKAFYAALAGGASEAAALSTAQRSFITAGGERAHPMYWAPFLLMSGPG
jgi:CHAT domain-containing protein